jgi:hypothetical protein
MAYIPELEAGEKLIRQFKVKFSKKAQPFHFAVSDRALYWPEKKLIALNDPFYFRRIPHHQVQTVSLKKLAPYALWLLALLMIIAGLAMGFLLLLPFLEHVPGDHTVSGWPLALVVGGILLPFVARGRFGLSIQTSDKSLTWKPPLVVDKSSRTQLAATLNDMLESCQQAGLRVLDGQQR